MKSNAILLLALSACVASCGQKPLKVKPDAPVYPRVADPGPEELLRGAENEERHDQLITWVERQLERDSNTP
jgi:predicted small lipoprotein YifL